MTQTDYIILEESSAKALRDRVREYQQRGWSCQGGVAMLLLRKQVLPLEGPAILWTQAMVKMGE